jgi:hypothetical protein
MVDERHDESQDPTKDLENVEATELDDKDLEDASGGAFQQPSDTVNVNCGC